MAGVLVMTICCLKVLRSPGNPARALTVLPLVLLPADFALRVSNRWSTGELMDRTLLQVIPIWGHARGHCTPALAPTCTYLTSHAHVCTALLDIAHQQSPGHGSGTRV